MVDKGHGRKGIGVDQGPPRSIVRHLKKTGTKSIPFFVKRMYKEKYSKTVKVMAANQAAYSFGNNISIPFFSYYLVRLGGTSVHIGLMQSLQYIMQNGLQFPSAYLSDRLGKRIPFIISGIGIASLLLLLLTQFKDILVIIGLIALLSAALSIYFPSWSALLGDELTCVDRGYTIAGITTASITAGLMGSISAFMFISISSSNSASAFQLPFITGALSFFLSILFIFFLKETPVKSVTKLLRPKYMEPRYLYLVKIQGVFNFFMALAWPLFPLTITKVLKASNIEIAIVTFITVLSTAAFQPLMGKLVDRFGSVPLIRTTRIVFIAVPFVYMFTTDIRQIYLWAIFEGMMASLVNISFISYVLDSSPPETRAEYFAFYNMSLGIGISCGTLLGGLSVSLLQQSMSLAQALFYVYLVSGVGRSVAVFLYIWLKKPQSRPSPPGQMAVASMELIRRMMRRH